MVWHDDKCVDADSGEPRGQQHYLLINDVSSATEYHPLVRDVAEDAAAPDASRR